MPSFRKINLLFAITLITNLLHAQNVTEAIKLNQLGFYPGGPKLAIVTSEAAGNDFYITSTNLRDTVYKARLGEVMQSRNSSVKTRVADFSALHQQGNFVVLVPGVGHSYVFSVADNVNHAAAVAGLKGFYFQRASMPLQTAYAGAWHRGAGHPDDKVYVHASAASAGRPEGTVISSPGGWYDAGDYNKYVVNSGITMGTLLSAYEDFESYYKNLHTNLPESNDAIPDILNEVLYNLRWMLTMQDPNDGGVYHKCTNASFDGMIMPGITKEKRYVVQKGTAATLDFAAVTAQSARILKQYNKQLPGLADSCLKASLKAWQWALANPAVEYNQDAMNKKFASAVTTGAYGDRSFDDEWLWAAAELLVTKGGNEFANVVRGKMKEKINVPSWANVATLGYYTLVRKRKTLPAYAGSLADTMQSAVLQLANGLLPAVEANAFKTVMGQSPRDFNWGSNSNAANQGIALLNAYAITRNKKYIDYALSNVDYLLGRNATGYCFLSGVGSKPIMHPHHRPSVADGVTDPVPGLLSGGPNPGKQDKCSYDFSEPETTFSDTDCSYASNEIAINWNAPFVYLLNAIEALQKAAGY